MADHAVKFASVLLITPLLVRSLGDEPYGLWLILTTIFAYLTLLDLGITVSGTHYAARAMGSGRPEAWLEVMGNCHRVYCRIGWLSLAGCALLALLVPALFPAAHRRELTIVSLTYGCAVALRFFVKPFAVALRAHVRYDLLVIPALLRTVVQTFALWVVVKAKMGLLGLGITFTLCEIAETCLVTWLAAVKLPLSWKTLRDARKLTAQGLVRHARASFLTAVGYNLRGKVDPLVVSVAGGFSMVTTYSVGTRFLTFFQDIINALLGGQFLAAFSHVEARDGPERMKELFLKCTRFGVMASVLGGGAMLIFGLPFIQRWMGPTFAGSHAAFLFLAILTPAYVLHLMQYPSGNLIYSLGHPQYLAWLTFLGGIFNLIVSLLLVWKIGIYGVAWGTVAELGIVSLFALPWLICRLSGIPLGEYVRMLLLDLVLASIPVAAFWLAIRGSLKADYLVICWQAAFYVLACVVWYWWVLFRKADREQTLNLLLPRRQPDKHES